MKCPKCEHEQENQVECEKCGLIFKSYYDRVKTKFQIGVTYLKNNELENAKENFQYLVDLDDPNFKNIKQQALEKLQLIEKSLLSQVDDTDEKIPSTQAGDNQDLDAGNVASFDTEAVTEQRDGGDSDQITCPFCKETIKKNAALCKHCNSKLPSSRANNILKKYNTFEDKLKAKHIIESLKTNKVLMLSVAIPAIIILTITIYCSRSYLLNYMGNLYFNGEIVEKNYSKALEYLTKAARPDSKCLIGKIYQCGLGVELNNEKAFYWFDQAAKAGSSDAEYQLALLYQSGAGVEQNNEKAFYWFDQAAKAGSSDAEYQLALLYKNGDGVNENADMASKLMYKAAKEGHKGAIEYVEMSHKDMGFLKFEDHLDATDIKDYNQLVRIISVESQRITNLKLTKENLNIQLEPIVAELFYVDSLTNFLLYKKEQDNLRQAFSALKNNLLLRLQQVDISENVISSSSENVNPDIFTGENKGTYHALTGKFGTDLLNAVISNHSIETSVDLSEFSSGYQANTRYQLNRRKEAIDTIVRTRNNIIHFYKIYFERYARGCIFSIPRTKMIEFIKLISLDTIND